MHKTQLAHAMKPCSGTPCTTLHCGHACRWATAIIIAGTLIFMSASSVAMRYLCSLVDQNTSDGGGNHAGAGGRHGLNGALAGSDLLAPLLLQDEALRNRLLRGVGSAHNGNAATAAALLLALDDAGSAGACRCGCICTSLGKGSGHHWATGAAQVRLGPGLQLKPLLYGGGWRFVEGAGRVRGVVVQGWATEVGMGLATCVCLLAAQLEPTKANTATYPTHHTDFSRRQQGQRGWG